MAEIAFGLPAENAAIKHNIHPKTWTYQNISSMNENIKKLGISFAWNYECITKVMKSILAESKKYL
nr:hypothetical protein [Mycoplasmopsis bovis]